MHHSSLATITKSGIRFSSDILTPLSIRNDTPVWAAYYPRPQDYTRAETYHDLMMTVVPYDCWLFSGRFRVWLKQQVHGGLHQLISIFRDNGMSIICSEASRSGHRYATCTTTVCLDSLMCKYNTYNNAFTPDLIEKIKVEVTEKIDQCVQDIEKRCKDFHFSDIEALGLEKPVMGERLDSLSYFFRKIAISKENNASSAYSKPWHFTCKDGLLCPDQRTINFMKEVMDDSLPSRSFAEINTREAQLRLAIIPTHKLRTFAWVVVSYKWRAPILENPQSNSVDTCELNPSNRNIAAEVSKIVSRRLNIWRFFSHISVRERSVEEGRFEFFACLTDNSLAYDSSALEGKWSKLEGAFNSYALDIQGAKIIKANVTPISFKRVFLSIRTHDAKREELLNICAEVGTQYGMLREDFRMVETHTRPAVSTVVQEIKNSHAMIQYYGSITKDKNNDDWLHAELLAAQVLDLPVVTVVEGEKKSPRTSDGKTPIRIDINPRRDEIFGAIETALREIHGIQEY